MERLPEAASTVYYVLRSAWRDFISIYYANTPTWRLLKSAALAFLGFGCWASGNLLLSVKPEWTWLNYLIAYGVLLVFYGPFTHIVVVPLAIRCRRRPQGFLNTLGKRVSKLNITFFILLVIAVGAVAPGFMFLDFGAYGGDEPDVDPTLSCERVDGVVNCTLSDEPGIHEVVVSTGGEELYRFTEPPYEWTVSEDELYLSQGVRRLQVDVYDEDGNRLRRLVQRFR